MDSSDWVRKKAEEIRGRRERKLIEDKARLADQERIKAQGPKMWAELQRLCRERAEALNKELGERMLQIREDKSRLEIWPIDSPNRDLDLGFDVDSLAYHLPNGGGGEYKLEVRQGSVQWVDRGVAVTADHIVEVLLEHVLAQI